MELLDQVHTKEEANIKDEDGDGDRYGSLFSEMTKLGIIYEQKRVRYYCNFTDSQNQYLTLCILRQLDALGHPWAYR